MPRLQLQRKDGTLIHVNLTESLLTREDQEVLLGVVDNITDQVLAERALQEQAKAAAIAAERARIAGELHDSVTQTLYTTSLIADALPKVWHTHPEEALESLQELGKLTKGALAEMRALLLELRPGEFAERDLSTLLRQLTDAMAGRTEIPIATTIIGNCQLPIEVRVAFYRIAQEALNNISKHARASRAAVSLNFQGDHTILKVSDNGRGFDPQFSQPDELGLAIMRERSQAIGAEFAINSSREKGTEIVVSWSPTEKSEGSHG